MIIKPKTYPLGFYGIASQLLVDHKGIIKDFYTGMPSLF